MGPLKHGGLALALSLSSSIQFFILIILLKKKIGEWNIIPVMRSAGKSLGATLLMGIAVALLYKKLFIPDPESGIIYYMTKIMILIIGGIIIYLGLAKIFRCGELESLGEILRSANGK